MFFFFNNVSLDVHIKRVVIKKKVYVGFSGFGAAWHLASIRVTNEKTKASWNFQCDNWLSKSDGDKQINRELIAEMISGGGDGDGGGGGGSEGDAGRDGKNRAAQEGRMSDTAKAKKKTAFAVTLVTMDKKNAGQPLGVLTAIEESNEIDFISAHLCLIESMVKLVSYFI